MSDNHKKANAAPRCEYLRLHNQPCTQPALKDHVFCRFHDLVDHPLPDARQIPFVEDATTLQVALMQVIRALQLGQINRATAGTILYALQIAASNLKHFSEECGHPFAQSNSARKPAKGEEEVVDGPSLAEILMERLQLVDLDDHTGPSSERNLPPNSSVVDNLQACWESTPSPARWRTPGPRMAFS